MTRQQILFSKPLFFAATAGFMALSVFAGPLEDARALYNAGKFGDVDAKLGTLLERKPISKDALELSFNAAIKAGKPYTAERRYTELTQKGEKLSSDILFEAALIAGQIGKPTVRRDRFIYFLNNEKGWNDKVEQALAFLCRDNGDAALFKRYAQNVQATDALFRLGMDMLFQMRTGNRTSDYITQVDTMMAKFTRADYRTRLLGEVSTLMDAPPQNFRREMFAVLSQFPLQDNPEFMRMATRFPEFNAPCVIDFCVKNNCVLPPALFKRAAKLATDINDAARRAEYVPVVQKLGTLVMAKDAAGNVLYPEQLCAFIEIILTNEPLFRKEPTPLYSRSQIASLFDMVAKALYTKDIETVSRIASVCVSHKALQDDHRNALIKSYPKAFDYRTLIYDTKISENAKKTKNLSVLKQMIAAAGNRPDLRWPSLTVAVDCGDKAYAKEIIREHILMRPVDFESDQVARNLFRADMGSAADCAAFLGEIFAKTGYSAAWKRLVEFPVNPYKEDAAWKQFLAKVVPTAKGSDPLLGACTALYNAPEPPNGQPLSDEIWNTAAAALKAYNGVFPDSSRPAQSPVIEAVWRRMYAIARHEKDKGRFVATFAKSLGKTGQFDFLLSAARDSHNITNLLAAAAAAIKSGAANPDDFASYNVPKGFSGSILAPYYKQMTPSLAAVHVSINCTKELWPYDVRLREIKALLDAHPIESMSDNAVSQLFDAWIQLAPTNSFFAQLPLEKAAVALFDQQRHSEFNRAKLLAVFGIGGQIEAATKRYLDGARKLDPASRYNAVSAICTYQFGNPVYGPVWLEKEGEEIKVNNFGAIVRDELVPAIKAVPRKASPLLRPVESYRYPDMLANMSNRVKQDDALKNAIKELCTELLLRSDEGLGLAYCDPWRFHNGVRQGARALLEKKDAAGLARAARRLGNTYAAHTDGTGQFIMPLLNDMVKAEIWEPAHILSSSIPGEIAALSGQLQRVRSECATHMPGIYPVAENHPLYPLYVAADELEHNNSERSWALLQKNLQTFEREAGKLPPNFVAWGVEQLRHARGKDDALITKAVNIIDALLVNESSLTPELAASLLLTKAEAKRDQRNYEAAKLEYQTIRNGAYYKGTKAARRAMFRDVDLLIDMGNVSSAEQLIEFWMSQPDVEIQAQAHYFMARIAFERKDYEETRKQLDEVFNLDFTHTDGRLLHGKWKLATNSEVDDTNVILGNISDRTIIRPGQELAVSVQDRNLGVAGGGASIPIVIRTSIGKDVEVIQLYPSVRNPYIFNGNIPTSLGIATPTNRVLEVTGDDEVSYQVEPEFLAARGLTTTEPKTLRVVDDARLAIGAAAPLAEDGKAEADLERQITSTSTEPTYGQYAQVVNNLKPGNPIYVVVRDRDRSVSANPDTITVDARTSSGDRLEGIVLTETGPATGIFRGQIRTQLPPPRASASDVASGSNPGDVINSKREGTWKSVSDGVQGKWLEIDTMGSHSVSNVAIMMSPEQAKNIRAIRLTGRLVNETTRFATLPQEDINQRYGIHYQVAAGRKLNQESLIRSEFSSAKAPAAKKVNGLSFVPVVPNRDFTQNALLSCPFMLPAGQSSVRFRLMAKDTKGRTLAGLWMAIAVDGVTVFSGQGNSLHRKIVDFDVLPGPHQLEIFFSANFPEDALDILVEDETGKTEPFPAAWIDPKTAPALTEFVQDSARIKRIDGGFQATFTKPVRVRSLRWEFLDYAGRELEIKKVYVQNNKGALIIPVESDYSDAMSNDTLEVAPGDAISVSYNDERTSSGEKRVLEKNMSSSFNDASCHFYFEQIVDTRSGNRLFLYDAYRFVPGDMLLVSVFDPDEDVSPEADSVKVKIKTRSGHEKVMTLTEIDRAYENIPRNVPEGSEGVHGGHFLGQLRTCEAGDAAASDSALPIEKGDIVTLSYYDRENTRPGVPVERTATVAAVQATTPVITLYNTRSEREEDTSVDAKLRLAQIRRRPGNERIDKLYRDQLIGEPMDRSVIDVSPTNEIPVNVSIPVPILVTDPSSAKHEASTIVVEAVAGSELENADLEGRDPEVVLLPLKLGPNFGNIRIDGVAKKKDAALAGVFSAALKLHLGPPDPSVEVDEFAPPELSVNGNDTIRLRVLTENGDVSIERTLRLVSDGRLSLTDSSYTADRDSAHVGERFFVLVQDPDQDVDDELNEVEVEVTAKARKVTRKIILKETLPHSGIFTGMVRPVIFAPGEAIPAVATGGVTTAEEDMADDRIAVRYGDTLLFTYNDEVTIPSKKPGLLEVTGKVFKGSDGNLRLFSKRFRDVDQAVLVQFRLAECLFETAKEHRRLKQAERSAEAIQEGKFILEEALRNYPTTTHVVQGEYLLANLYYELAMEEKEAKREEAAIPLFTEALSRFSSMLSTWPESEFAPRAQYHKALCLEMLKDYNRAAEEYVKMTYLYPESPLVGDASIRLASYYYKQEQRYDTAGRIYANFQKRFPTHDKADRALFLSAQCHMKQAESIAKKATAEKRPVPTILVNEEYKEAVEALKTLTEVYRDTATVALRAQAMYWAGDASLRAQDYETAFIYLKRTVFEYPETEWARRARGLLLQEQKRFEKLE